MKKETVFLCDVSICRDLCLKLQIVDKVDVTYHKASKSTPSFPQRYLSLPFYSLVCYDGLRVIHIIKFSLK